MEKVHGLIEMKEQIIMLISCVGFALWFYAGYKIGKYQRKIEKPDIKIKHRPRNGFLDALNKSEDE